MDAILEKNLFQPKLLTRNTIALKRNSIPIDRRKIIADHDLQIKFEELKEFAKEMIVTNGQYGQAGLPDEELRNCWVMSNQDEARKLSEQLMSKKFWNFTSPTSYSKRKIVF